MNYKSLIKIVIITTITARFSQLLLFYFSNGGKTSLWNNWFLNTFDHYQLGILLLIFSIFIKNSYKIIVMGIGIGLIIDETNSILNLISLGKIPYSFNSFSDLLMTIIALGLFVGAYRVRARAGGARTL